jgi:hypothetical protein
MKYRKVEAPAPVEPATRAEALKFIEELQALRPEDDKYIDVAAVREHINKFPLGTLQGYARRIMTEIMKSRIEDDDEQPDGDRKPELDKGPAAKRGEPAAAGKTPSKGDRRVGSEGGKAKGSRRKTTPRK